MFSKWLVYISPVISPYVLIISYPPFRQAFKLMCCCKSEKEISFQTLSSIQGTVNLWVGPGSFVALPISLRKHFGKSKKSFVIAQQKLEAKVRNERHLKPYFNFTKHIWRLYILYEYYIMILCLDWLLFDFIYN